MRRLRPVAVVGFGGYPTLPPMFAATQVGVPTVIHDQNAVMGRANRQLSTRVTAIATSFPGVLDGNPALAAKATFTGNPVRPMVIEAAASPMTRRAPMVPSALRLRRQPGRPRHERDRAAGPGTGGSGPARPPERRPAGPREDRAAVEAAYSRLGVTAEVRPFFVDLPARIAAAHLVIGRPAPPPSPSSR